MLSPAINLLAEAYENLLFNGILRDRLSHHLAHVASEQWLAMELAFLVNERGSEFGLPGWSAILESKQVDVTLVPPGADPRAPLSPDSILIELKLSGTDWWKTVWRDVRLDLAGNEGGKAKADFAVCFVMNPVSHSLSARRTATDRLYRDYLASVPMEPGEFSPVTGEPPLYLLRSSSEHRMQWIKPIYGKWPSGYDASMRIVWVTECGRAVRSPG